MKYFTNSCENLNFLEILKIGYWEPEKNEFPLIDFNSSQHEVNHRNNLEGENENRLTSERETLRIFAIFILHVLFPILFILGSNDLFLEHINLFTSNPTSKSVCVLFDDPIHFKAHVANLSTIDTCFIEDSKKHENRILEDTVSFKKLESFIFINTINQTYIDVKEQIQLDEKG